MLRRRQLPLSQALILLGILAIGGLGAGCPGECVGAGCDDAFEASAAVVHLGGGGLVRVRGLDPRDGAFTLRGGANEGAEWALGLTRAALWVGAPQASTVVSYALGPEDPTGRRRLDLSTQDSLPDDVGALFGEASTDRFGAAFARVPDPDGVADLLVGAPGLLGGSVNPDAGGVYLFEDLGDGLSGSTSASTARLRVLSEAAGDRLGSVVAACGDLDGDGEAELVASAPWDSSVAALGGRVDLALSTTLAALGDELLLAGQLERSFTLADDGARLGHALWCAGDLGVGGAGVADLVLTAPFADVEGREGAGAVYLLHGETLPSLPDGAASMEVSAVADRVIAGEAAGDYLGWALAVGDVNGDGQDELAIGAPGAGGPQNSARGQALLISGAALAAGEDTFATLTGETGGDQAGAALAIGDLDGDGYAELLIGAPRANPTDSAASFAAGILYVFAGAADFPLDGVRSVTRSEGRITAEQQFLSAGQALALGPLNAGLVNDDGEAATVGLALTVNLSSD
ncbi:integrin alpha [Myxococcota bacterium]|nr:integrin alpha [Myxococcota bacterium]